MVFRHLLEFYANVALEEGRHVRSITEKIGGGQNGPFRDLIGYVLRCDIAHLQVAALEGNEFRSLLEEIAAVIRLQLEAAADFLTKHLRHLGTNVLLGKHCREFQGGLVLSQRRKRQSSRSHCNRAKEVTPLEIVVH